MQALHNRPSVGRNPRIHGSRDVRVSVAVSPLKLGLKSKAKEAGTAVADKPAAEVVADKATPDKASPAVAAGNGTATKAAATTTEKTSSKVETKKDAKKAVPVTTDVQSPATATAAAAIAAVAAAAAATVAAPEKVAEKAAGKVPAIPKVPPPTHLRNLVFVSAEVAPWSKTGGLGDVIGSLPIALAARGHRVMVVAPRYGIYPEAFDMGVGGTNTRIKVLGAEVGFFHYIHKGVDWVFVDHPSYQGRDGLYADANGVYQDNQFRFALLSLAACEAPLNLAFGEKGKYGEDCVFIANDWHAALVPVYLAAKYRPHGVYKSARSIMAIHNLRHQGVHPPGTFASLGLPGWWYPALEYQYPPHLRQGAYEEEGRSVNHLKGGLVTADRVMTVSPGYAEEIKSWLGGWGMEGVINQRAPVLNGIVNGIDTEDWNPATDKHIYQTYDITNFTEGKKANKVALQEELGLPVDPDIPLIAFIGRLDYQKGADIVMQAAPWMMAQGVQLVCLGTGSPDLENGLRWLEASYKDQARGWVGFNVGMSHKLTAAADVVLMPSRFEPCGLNQLYAMRYGAVPVAHATGGLKDTVLDFNPEDQSGTGWTFQHCDVQGLMHAIGLALFTLQNHPEDFQALQQRGMSRDSSWEMAASQYEQLFDWAAFDAPFCG